MLEGNLRDDRAFAVDGSQETWILFAPSPWFNIAEHIT